MSSSKDTINQKSGSKWASSGLIAAFSASLCCITPVLALVSGAGGMAATFSWAEPLRPYLIGLTTIVLGIAWYQKLKPQKQEQIDCECVVDVKEPSIQTKGFLGIVTVLAIVLLAFPSYSHIFYSNFNHQDSSPFIEQDTTTVVKVELAVKGMTCTGCEAYIEHEIRQLNGIKNVDASYDKGTTAVEYKSVKVSLQQIIEAINKTGYKVIENENQQ